MTSSRSNSAAAPRTRTAGAAVLLVALGLAGCSEGPARKAAHSVHGRVTFAGKPVARATVLFVPVGAADRKYQPNATTDADGRYTLTTYTSNDGAPEGEYTVALFCPDAKGRPKKLEPGEAPEDALGPDLLKGKYWPASASALRATVKPERDNELDFVLP